MTTFVPSPEQQAIFDTFERIKGNLAIEARAGTGKTTVLVNLAKRLPEKASKVYCAFNKDIVGDVQPKLDGTGMTAKTFHSFGYGAIAKLLNAKLNPSGEKYKNLAKQWLGIDTGIYRDEVDAWIREQQAEYGDEFDTKEFMKEFQRLLVSVVDFGRYKLIDWSDTNAIIMLIMRYGLDEALREYEDSYRDIAADAAQWMMQEGERLLKEQIELDFTDMIYWTVKYDLPLWGQDYVFVDECQDLSPMQRALVKKLIRRGTGRIVLVGDPKQAIYAFAGADSDSFELSVKEFNATVLPLTYTRRCAEVIVRHAQRLVPDFNVFEGTRRGKFIYIPEDHFTKHVKIGDMVISRVNAPLIAAALDLLAIGKPAIILGNDISKAIMKILDKLESRRGYTFAKILDVLHEWKIEQLEKLMKKGDEQAAERIKDQCDGVRILVERAQANSLDGLRSYITNIFADTNDDGKKIRLCSAHKAKGLEASRVYLLAPEKFQLNFPGMGKEARTQEDNLLYVAITRAKDELIVLTNKKYLDTHPLPKYGQTSFDDIDWSNEVIEIIQPSLFEAQPALKVYEDRLIEHITEAAQALADNRKNHEKEEQPSLFANPFDGLAKLKNDKALPDGITAPTVDDLFYPEAQEITIITLPQSQIELVITDVTPVFEDTQEDTDLGIDAGSADLITPDFPDRDYEALTEPIEDTEVIHPLDKLDTLLKRHPDDIVIEPIKIPLPPTPVTRNGSSDLKRAKKAKQDTDKRQQIVDIVQKLPAEHLDQFIQLLTTFKEMAAV